MAVKSTLLFACTVCFSSVQDDPMMIALRASMLCLLIVTFTMLALFAKFFLGIRKRERALKHK